MEPVKAVTFDCYGTLIDWEAGLGTCLYDLARRSGDRDPPPGRELRERWEEIQLGLFSGEYRGYYDILVDTLRTWVGERGYRWNVAVAKSKGMPAAWVNRHRRQAPGEEAPDHEWDSLWGLAEFVGQQPT